MGVIDNGRMIAVGRPDALIAESRADSTLVVATSKPLVEPGLRLIPGVTACQQRANAWIIKTTDVTATIAGLSAHLASEQIEILDLRIQRPSLEDAFHALTGRAWSASPQEGPR